MKFGHSLAGRLSAWLIILITLVFSMTTVIDYYISRDHVLTEARLSAKEEVVDSVHQLERLLYSVQKTTDQLAVVLGYSSITPQMATSLLTDLVSSNQDLFGAAIALEPNHTVDYEVFARYVYRSGEDVWPVDLTATANTADSYLTQVWYSKAKQEGKPVWSEPYYDEYGSQVLMVTYSVPIYQQASPLLYQKNNKQFIGVLTADVTLESIMAFMNQIRVGESGFAFLTSEQGKLLSFPDRQKVLSPLFELFQGKSVGSSETQLLWNEAYQTITSGDSGVIRAPCFSEDSDCVYGYTSLDATHWPLVVVIKEDEYLQPLHDYLRRVFILGLLTVGVLLVVIHLVIRKVISPISSLSRLVGRIGEGDLSTILPKVHHKDEVHTLVDAVSQMQSHLKKYIRSLERETALTARLRGEMDAATKIQMAMLPGEGQFHASSDKYEIDAVIDPAKSVGGDLYFYHPTEDGESYFVIGDVSDKGVPASLFMAKTITLLNQLVSQWKRPSEILYELNNELEKNNEACMFVTLWCGILDHQQNLLEFASGGHMAPYLVPSVLARGVDASDVNALDLKPQELVQENGMALGLMPNMDFPSNQVELKPGDKLFLYTDGVDEAQNRQREFFGINRLVSVLSKLTESNASEMVNTVYNHVKTFAQDTYQSDDITLMAIKLKHEDIESASTSIAVARVSERQRFMVSANSVHMILEWAETFWKDNSLAESRLFDVKLCLEELFSNILRYSGQKDPDSVDVMLTVYEEGVHIQLLDSGYAFDPFVEVDEPELGLDADDEKIGGFGIHLVKELSYKQCYQRIDDVKNQVDVYLSLNTDSADL